MKKSDSAERLLQDWKKGDLLRVNRPETHRPCQYKDYVVLLEKLGKGTHWTGINLSTGNYHHYAIWTLEFVSESR